jgi:hypothetical protein
MFFSILSLNGLLSTTLMMNYTATYRICLTLLATFVSIKLSHVVLEIYWNIEKLSEF